MKQQYNGDKEFVTLDGRDILCPRGRTTGKKCRIIYFYRLLLVYRSATGSLSLPFSLCISKGCPRRNPNLKVQPHPDTVSTPATTLYNASTTAVNYNTTIPGSTISASAFLSKFWNDVKLYTQACMAPAVNFDERIVCNLLPRTRDLLSTPLPYDFLFNLLERALFQVQSNETSYTICILGSVRSTEIEFKKIETTTRVPRYYKTRDYNRL